jgi:riboflavin synthase
VVKVAQEGGSWQIAIRARAEMAPFIAEKGSITVNGVSLTVNDVRDRATAPAISCSTSSPTPPK